MSDKPKYTELALLIQPIGKAERYSSSASATWIIEFVTVDRDKMQPRGIGDYFDYAEAIRGFQDLQIRTHLWGDSEQSFSYDLKFSEIYSASLRDLERRYKALQGLERKWRKVAEQYGSPQSIGEYVGQIMLAAGINESYEAVTDGGYTYDDSKWRRRDVAGTRSHIMQLRYQWFQANGPKKEEADAA